MLPNAAAWLVAPHPLIKASSKTFFHFSTHHHKTARVSGPWVRMGTEISRGEYAYGSFNCAFRKKAASAGRENEMPLLLVHPANSQKSVPLCIYNIVPDLRNFGKVGIGLSSWFWDKFLDEWNGGEVFVPDLIGCGDSEPWRPGDEGMFVPLDWVRALEELWTKEIRRQCVVVVQGGLGPVGVQMAARQTGDWDGSKAVGGFVLVHILKSTLSSGFVQQMTWRFQ
jgi:pimeloyl-ACP methyl ester carboxylesterase